MLEWTGLEPHLIYITFVVYWVNGRGEGKRLPRVIPQVRDNPALCATTLFRGQLLTATGTEDRTPQSVPLDPRDQSGSRLETDGTLQNGNLSSAC